MVAAESASRGSRIREQTTAFNWHRETGDYAATVAALLNAAP
jgi:hypothetical protein